jgi:hypothetical protein
MVFAFAAVDPFAAGHQSPQQKRRMTMRPIDATLALAGALSLACSHGAGAADLGQPTGCLIAGDSIALDVGRYAPYCATDARIGIGSGAIISRVRPARLVVISAGSNDPDNPRLADNLERMRARAGAARVAWIVPVDPRAAAAVRAVARRRGDALVAFAPARDGVHPRCPRCVARQIFPGEGACAPANLSRLPARAAQTHSIPPSKGD